MADISASFRNDYSESRLWIIWDTGRDSSYPPVIFSDYLGPGDTTAALSIYSEDGNWGHVMYQRPADGAPTIPMDISNGDTVSMT